MPSITIDLKAVTGSFETDMKRAAKEAERAFGQMKSAAAEIGTAFGAAIAASATAITALVKSSIDAADHMNDLAKKIGISTEAMSGLGYAASKSGSDFDALNSGLIKLAKNAADAAAGGKENAQLFAAIGINVKDAAGEVKGADVLFREVADRFKDYKDGSAEAALAIKLFGKSGADLIQTLNEGSGGLKEMEDRARALGLVISSDLASQSDEFNDTLGDIKGLLTGVGNAMAEAVLPTLQKFADLIVDSGMKAQVSKGDFELLVDAFKAVAVGVAIVKNSIEALVNVLGAVGTAVTATFNLLGTSLKNSFSLIEAIATASPEKIAKAWEENNKRSLAALTEFDAAIKGAFSAAADGVQSAISDVTDAFSAAYIPATKQATEATDALGKASGQTEVPLSALGGASSDAAKAAEELAKAQKSALDMLDTLRGKTDESAQAQAEFDKGMRALEESMEAWAIAGGDVPTILAAWQEGEALLRAEFERTNDEITKRGDILGNYMASIKADKSLAQMTERQRAIATAVNQVTEAWKKESADGGKMAQTLEAVKAGATKAAAAFYDLAKANDIVKELGQKANPYQQQLDAIEELQKAIDIVGDKLSEAFDPDKLKGYEEAQARISMQVKGMQLQAAAESISTGLSSLQSLAQEGSAAYAQMQVAIDAANLAAAIGAIMNQGMGDPYTAFARMAAMAVLVAKFVGSVGTVAGGFSDSSAKRQASQGTGSVLGDPSAKSESIANAIEITADATQQLVGLNRGMLSALLDLKDALGAAGGMLARGAGEADFSGMNLAVGASFLGSKTADPLGIFKGKSKITDQGIVIFGGALNDLLQNIAVGAYQEVKSKSWAFGSTHTKTGMQDVSDEFAKQFGLVMQSIADTVREGALALGMLPADIEAAMAAFKVEEMKISLKDLSAEEQQEEIEAVFSKIFDGLAGAVVPYIEQFQKVGEGLGETLVRIATEVQVTQEAFAQLGLAVNESNPEKFAQIADGLVNAAGGLDEFISGFQSFVANFASEGQKFEVAQNALNSAFTQAGLTVPTTRDAMWELMQSLDATTESGREQIATLLRLSDTANAYYDALDQRAESALKYAQMVAGIDAEIADLAGSGATDFQKALADIAAQQRETIDQLNATARAAGLQGAREEDLAKVHQLAAARAVAAAKQLEMQSRDLVAQLYGSGQDSLTSSAQSAGSALSSVAEGLQDVASAAEKFRDSMLIDSQLSPLNTQKQFEEAMRQLRATGDESIARRALELADRLMARGADYTRAFNEITSLVRAQPDDMGGAGSGAWEGSASAQAMLSPAERADLAQQLARNVADLSGFGGTTYEEVAASLGLDLGRLGQDLGLQGQALTDYLDAIKADSYTIDDLDGVIARQVDRIVEAILNGTDSTGSMGSAITGGKGIADVSATVPQVEVVATSEGMAPASDESVQATNEKLDSMAVVLTKLTEIMANNVKVTAGGSEEMVDAVMGVQSAVEDMRRELGYNNDGGNFRTRTMAR